MATVPSSREITRHARSLLRTLMTEVGGNDRGREADIIAEIVGTCVRLLRDRTSVGDVKILNTALKELRYAFKMFARYRGIRKVSIFGSARIQPRDTTYRLARHFAREIAAANFMVITGAGPGIMRACQEGAGRERSFGVNIRLPFEQEANEFINRDEKLVSFKYFFTRKILFMKEAHAVVLFPGGFGTHDESFEALTLAQTGKTDPMPIVFLDLPRGTYWKSWESYVHEHMLRRHLISEADLSLFLVTGNVSEAVREITTFYRVYHSVRVVGDRYVIRLTRPISGDLLAMLNEEFSDILTEGTITQQQGPLPAEADDVETASLPRLVMRFNRGHQGRLRQMIDVLNHKG